MIVSINGKPIAGPLLGQKRGAESIDRQTEVPAQVHVLKQLAGARIAAISVYDPVPGDNDVSEECIIDFYDRHGKRKRATFFMHATKLVERQPDGSHSPVTIIELAMDLKTKDWDADER